MARPLFFVFCVCVHLISCTLSSSLNTTSAARQLLGFGQLISSVNTKTLKPLLRKSCHDNVRKKTVDKSHPMVFACGGIGKMRATFRVTPHADANTSMLLGDKLIVYVSSGENCLYAPNAALLMDGCYTKYTKTCSASNMAIQVRQGPACVIVYCDNVWDECDVDADVDIYQEVKITERRDNIIGIGDAVIRVPGTGFSMDPERNKVMCIDQREFEIDCRVLKVNTDGSIVDVYLNHAVGRESVGPFYMKFDVEEIGWTDFVIVGTVTDPWPLALIQKIIYIVAGVVAGLAVFTVLREWWKQFMAERAWAQSAFQRAMRELDMPEEARRFEGYFTGIAENWRPEDALKPTASDEFRRQMLDKRVKSEQELLKKYGVVYK